MAVDMCKDKAIVAFGLRLVKRKYHENERLISLENVAQLRGKVMPIALE